MSDKTKERIVLALQLFVGAVFVFSGFVKAVDPLGGLYKITDYLNAFHWDALKVLGFSGMTIMSAVEFVLGVGLLLGIQKKMVTLGTLAFMVFYTPLTLYLAIANPVSDCGCFGDALVITNWQTFWKNVILLAAVVLIWEWLGYSKRGFCKKAEWAVLGYTFVFSLIISVYCFQNLPIMDFRPYRIGANIQEGMSYPEGAKKDSIRTTFIYEKNGVKQEFNMQNYPKDTSWHFVDSKNEIVEKGYEPPIHDFVLNHSDDGDITDLVLEDTNYVFLLVAHNLTEFNIVTNPGGCHYDNSEKVNSAYEYAHAHGYKFYCLTATSEGTEEMNSYLAATNAKYEYLNADEIMLKTIIRSSPGLMIIKKGTVVNKWALKNIPTFSEPLDSCEAGQMKIPNNKLTTLFIALLYLIPLGVGYIFSKKRNKECEKA